MPAFAVMPLERAYDFAASNGLAAEAEEIRLRTPVHQDFRKGKQVRKARLLELFESKGLLQRFMDEQWPSGLTEKGERRRRSYSRDRDENQRLLSADPRVASECEPGGTATFGCEAHLRDFLAHNLGAVEPGLRLYREGRRSGVEYPIDGRSGRIDLLAIDVRGRPVVIELKLSVARVRVIDQLRYYMKWVDEHLGKGPSRGIIVAGELPADLVLATERLPGVTLLRYTIALSLEAVGPSAHVGERTS